MSEGNDYSSSDDLVFNAAMDLLKAMDKHGEKLMGKAIADIVKGHSAGATAASLASGWIPGAGGAIAATISAGFIWSMYYRINEKLGIPFSKNVVKSIGTGVCTNLASYAVGSVVISGALSLLPGLGTIGALALISGTVYSLTWSSGLIYLKILASFARQNRSFNNISESDLKRTADDIIKNEDVNSMMNQAKEQYNASKKRGEINKNAKFDKEEF
ncbi:MAG: hypothetical protein IJG38_09705 [Thermoguttaceae bacterium]|nr:hypothetical protein [Thermoguttaceae bacterium]MBQ6615064.1 hypothetical protein [Thermoguttaceae bacterium]